VSSFPEIGLFAPEIGLFGKSPFSGKKKKWYSDAL
jgi:hypothetical protein